MVEIKIHKPVTPYIKEAVLNKFPQSVSWSKKYLTLVIGQPVFNKAQGKITEL